LSSPWALDAIPAALLVIVGAFAITFSAGGGTRSTHLFWLSLVLAENAFALLLRRRHPVAALAGVLATYFVFDFPPIALPALVVAMSTIAASGKRRVIGRAGAISALVVVAVPLLHRDSLPLHAGLALAALGSGLALGWILGGVEIVPADETSPDLRPIRQARRGLSLDDMADRDSFAPLNVVETDGLTKRFGDTTVVSDVDLRVPRGTAFGYLGPNGAGKTTLIRMLLGLIRPTGGSMKLLGLPVPTRRRQALARVGAIVDEPRFHGHMTGRQNLWALAAAREPEAHARIEAALDRVGLLDRGDDRVSKYSMGMRQRLGIAACLIADPDLLILDEPMNGLDPAGMLELRELMGSLVAEGRTIVLSSHLLDEVEKTCDAIAIVDRGNVVLQGRIADLTADAAAVLRLECSTPARAAVLLRMRTDVESVREEAGELLVHLASDDLRGSTAHIAHVLLDAGFELYRLQLDHASLEQRFLDLTTRLGEAA